MARIGKDDHQESVVVDQLLKKLRPFDRTYVAKFPNSSETPFISETYAFTQHMEKFFAGVRDKGKTDKKKSENEKKSEKTTAKAGP